MVKLLNQVIVNDSYTFILPMLLSNAKNIDTSYFHGCFIKSNLKPELDNHIFIVIRKGEQKSYSAYFNLLTCLPTYMGNYEYKQDDETYKVMIYGVPENFIKDYEFFKLGKYFNFSEGYKRKILDFFGINTNNHRLIHIKYILYKDPVFRKQWEERIGTKIPVDLDLHRIPVIEDESC